MHPYNTQKGGQRRIWKEEIRNYFEKREINWERDREIVQDNLTMT